MFVESSHPSDNGCCPIAAERTVAVSTLHDVRHGERE
jgi:hypothetical protein